MIKLTWPSGQVIHIEGKDVLRIRKTLPTIDGSKGNSCVDWVQRDLFEEPAHHIAKLVSGELETLTHLAMPHGDPVWFNGKKATGPYYVVPTKRTGGIASSFEIGNKLQYVSSRPEQVAAAIKAAGGKLLPIRRDDFTPEGTGDYNSLPAEMEVWDFEALDTPSALPS